MGLATAVNDGTNDGRVPRLRRLPRRLCLLLLLVHTSQGRLQHGDLRLCRLELDGMRRHLGLGVRTRPEHFLVRAVQRGQLRLQRTLELTHT